jgi:hypothetical protein
MICIEFVVTKRMLGLGEVPISRKKLMRDLPRISRPNFRFASKPIALDVASRAQRQGE